MIKEAVLVELQKIVGKENVLTTPEALKAYSYDGTTSWIHEPDVVVFPINAQQISGILKLANAEKIPVTPRGGGTNVSGGSVPWMGGIVLVTTKMNQIVKIDKENLSATVEPGVVLQDLTMRLAKEGLFFPPDPQSFLGATLGELSRKTRADRRAYQGHGFAFSVTEHINVNIQIAFSRNTRVKLAYRTGGGVAGIGKERQAFIFTFFIQLLESGFGHINLAADFETRRRIFSYRKGNTVNRFKVLGDILAAVTVAARSALHKLPVNIGQGNGQAVHLMLADHVELS